MRERNNFHGVEFLNFIANVVILFLTYEVVKISRMNSYNTARMADLLSQINAKTKNKN